MEHGDGGLAAERFRASGGRFEASPAGASAGRYEDAGASDFATEVGFMGRVAGALGALSAAALVGGLGFWTYDLAVRDLTEVPVVRALEGPVRVAPDDPGGDVAAHQGLSVNSIQAAARDAEDEDTPDRVVLAPAAPDLAPDDVAPEALAIAAEEEAPADPVGVALAAATGEPSPVSDSTAEERPEVGPVDPIEAALAEALGMPAPGEGDAELNPAALGADAKLEATPAVAFVTPDGVVERSPRPTVRPVAELPAIADPAPEIAAEKVPAGTQLVQLGAFPTEAGARAEWSRLDGRLGAYLGGKAPVIQAASSDGEPFWRLRAAGFEDGADARRFCSALTAEEADCVPVVVR